MRVGIPFSIACGILAGCLAGLLAWHAAPLRTARAAFDPLLLFHLALTQLALLCAGCMAWVIHLRRAAIRARWRGASPRRKAAALALCLLGIELLLALLFWATRGRGVEELGYLRGLFFFGGEWNLPSLFSSLQLLLLGLLALLCARATPSRAAGRAVWQLMAAVTFYMAADELLMLHERFDDFAEALGIIAHDEQRVLAIAGWQVRPWTLVFFPVALLLGLVLGIGLARQLPARSFRLLVASGVLFIAGAVGLENIQAHQMASGAIERGALRAHVNMFTEEMLEMLGVTLAIYALALALFAWRTGDCGIGPRDESAAGRRRVMATQKKAAPKRRQPWMSHWEGLRTHTMSAAKAFPDQRRGLPCARILTGARGAPRRTTAIAVRQSPQIKTALEMLKCNISGLLGVSLTASCAGSNQPHLLDIRLASEAPRKRELPLNWVFMRE
jgi:hypothetical protein